MRGNEEESNELKLWELMLEDGARWHHLRADVPGAHKYLSQLGLDNWLVDALTAPETRPRSLSHEGGTLLVLRGVNANPGSDPEDMVSLRLWFSKELVITVRRKGRRLLSIQDVREMVDSGKGPKSAGGFVAALCERLTDRIGDFVDSIDESLSQFEADSMAADSPVLNRLMLAGTRREVAAVRRYLAPQRDALEAVVRTRTTLSDDDAYVVRDQADRMVRYVEDLDLARERALVLQEELQNRIAEQQNSRMYVLSMVSAIFLPLSFLTGVFGMNIGGIPGIENINAFWWMIGAFVVLTLIMLTYMRRRDWW